MRENIDEFAFQLMAIIQNPNSNWDFNGMAMRLFEYQFEHTLPYRKLCESRKATPQTINHWQQIPCFPTSVFKDYEVTSLTSEARTHWFLSSGTTTQRQSRHFHNSLSLKAYESSLLTWFDSCVLKKLKRDWRMISLTPSQQQTPHSSLVFMFDAFRRFFDDSVFLGETDDTGLWQLNYSSVIQCIQNNENQPVFLMGTAFLYVLLMDWMEERGVKLRLPEGSMALETGGYKGRVRHIDKATLHEKIQNRLGIGAHSIVCEYGMCELSSQAYGNPCFQFPPWARAQIVSPETGLEVGFGETGLIRVFDLANIHSVLAVQTEDLGIRRETGFNLLGRDNSAEPRGCSLMASD